MCIYVYAYIYIHMYSAHPATQPPFAAFFGDPGRQGKVQK